MLLQGASDQPESFCTCPVGPSMSSVLIAGVMVAYGLATSTQRPLQRVHPDVRSAVLQSEGPVKIWVYFRDKGVADRDRAAALAELRRSYDPLVAQRRLVRGAAAKAGGPMFTVRDLPVPAGYVSQVQTAGLRLANTSRWLNAVSGWADQATIEELAALSCTERITLVRFGRWIGPRPQTPASPVASTGPSSFYGLAHDQLWMHRIPRLHQRGYTGAGIVIGVLDTGFSRIHEAFHHPQRPIEVVAEYDFLEGDSDTGIAMGDPNFQHAHGTWILGTLAAYQPGQLIGAAYDASYILCKTEDTLREELFEEDNYVAGLEFIEAHGGDIATSSLAYIDWYTHDDLDGMTAVTTQAVNIATDLGIICLTAVGNRQQTVTPSLMAPSDAFDVISVGAVDLSGVLSIFSSNGPTADGRLKPEVLALGEGVYSVSESQSTGFVGFLSGTSLSTPLTAGAVACMLQARPDWDVSQMRQNLLQTASDWVETGEADPEGARGFGVIDAFRAFQDCNDNDAADLIDIAGGVPDTNGNLVPDVCESFGDLDADGDVDRDDYIDFLQCLAGPAHLPGGSYVTTLECSVAFSNGGSYVDLAGAAAFQNEYTGSAP